MINAQSKIALAFTAGVGVGGGIGYLIADHHIKKQAAADLEAVQAMFRSVREKDTPEPEPVGAPSPSIAEEERYQTPAHSIAAEEVIRLGYASEDTVRNTRPYNENYIPPESQEFDADDDIENGDPTSHKEEEVNDVRRPTYTRIQEADPDDVTTWDRDPHQPYVITESEFRIDRPEYEKDSLTYYSGDDTLAEESGAYIPDKNGTAGNENLKAYFGFGSGDSHLLYIRNDRVMTDFEITLNEGKYTKEVLDLDDDSTIPARRPVRRMRHGE